MINANEIIENGELILERLQQLIPLKANESKVDMVRVACHSEIIEKVLPAFDFLNKNGYISACNITQISDKTNDKLIELSSLLNGSKVDIIYFADSLGSASPSSIQEIVKALKSNWSGQLGIHAHDNRGLALSNTLKAKTPKNQLQYYFTLIIFKIFWGFFSLEGWPLYLVKVRLPVPKLRHSFLCL